MVRLVITGMGACSAVGDSADACFEAFVRGERGNKPLVHFDHGRFNKTIAYEREEVGDHGGQFRSSLFLKRALKEAIKQAGFGGDRDVSVYVGTGLRELRSAEICASEGACMRVADLDFSATVKALLPNAGEVYTLSNACAASNYALALACDAVQTGKTDIAIAAGCDTLTASMFGLLDRVNPEVPREVKVFDKQRKGVLMGDGGVAIVVEHLDTALSEGRTPLAEVRGVGMSSDAVHETAPDPEGIRRAIDDAHNRASTRPSDIDLIYVHGTGTDLNDDTESSVLAEVYQRATQKPMISGIKSMTGHTSGASGGIGVVAAVKSLETQRIPPTPGTEDVVDGGKGFPIFHEAQAARVDTVQVNAFGFGGVNAVAIVTRYNHGEGL